MLRLLTSEAAFRPREFVVGKQVKKTAFVTSEMSAGARLGLLVEGRLESAGTSQAGTYRSVLIHRLWPLEQAFGGYRGHLGEMAR